MKRTAALVLILAVAAIARLWNLTAGVPHAVGIDEPQIVDHALGILRSGDWNPHFFDYPSLVIYLQAIVAILRFLWGALNGEWASLDAFNVGAVFGAGRLVAAAIGVATIYVVYRLSRELASPAAALLAAAQLAVRPMHVRESRFILTDVPMTILAMAALWLTARAARRGTTAAYAWAGACSGLAAGAKYNGGIVLASVIAAWLINERNAPDRGRKLAAIVGAAALAFIASTPYVVLDLPSFLDGFAAQFSRFAVPASGTEPSWLLYLKHLSPAWARFGLPLAFAGISIAVWRGAASRWAPLIVFGVLYFYMLSSHSHVFGRYALPLVPLICILSSVAIVEAYRALLRAFPVLAGRRIRPLVVLAIGAGLLWMPATETVRWLDQQKRADTRALAADWLKGNAVKGARLAVENSGPTYLTSAGFRVVGIEVMVDHPIDWYRQRADYLVISGADLSRYGDYIAAGPTVFQINPTPQRWGPPVRIVRLVN